MIDHSIRARLAVEGIDLAAPVARVGGAGPTNDGHVLIDGEAMALPVNPASSFQARDGRVWLDGEDLDIAVDALARPRFYDRTTSDGVPMHMLARLHGSNVLATTVVQTCMRYEEAERCRYCSIEESLSAGLTTRVKTPWQLAEVARAAVDLDGIGQMVMTTGTATTPDRGARYLSRCVAAVKAAVPTLPIQVQCEPPDDPGALAALSAAGADAIGIHVESLDDAVRARWMPGKSRVPLSRYWAAWREAVTLFGRNQVSTYLLIGLGEDPAAVGEWAAALIDIGVYPFVVPVRPGRGTLAEADGLQSPPPALVAAISSDVARRLDDAGMRGEDQRAGCAACGACSTASAARSKVTFRLKTPA